MESWVRLIGWHTADTLPTKYGNLSTIDWEQGRESLLAKDQHPNHCAMPPTVEQEPKNNIFKRTEKAKK